MRVSTLATVYPATLLALVASVMATTVNSPPSLIQCQPALLTFSGAPEGNVFLSIIRGGDAASPNLVTFPTAQGPQGQVTWQVNLASGTSITIKAVDATGATAYSDPVSIQDSDDSACVGQDASASAGGASSAASSGSSAASSAASSGSSSASSGASSASSGASSSATSRPTSASSGPSTSDGTSTSAGATSASADSGAVANTVSAAAVGLAAMVALFA